MNLNELLKLNIDLPFGEYANVSKKNLESHYVYQQDILNEYISYKENNKLSKENNKIFAKKIKKINENIELLESKISLAKTETAKFTTSQIIKWILWVVLIVYCISLFILPLWMLVTSFRDINDYDLPSSSALWGKFYSGKDLFANYKYALNMIENLSKVDLFDHYSNYTTIFGTQPLQFYLLAILFGPEIQYNIWSLLLVSIIYSVGISLFNVFFTTLMAYILAKYKFPGRGLIYTIGILVMIVPIVGSGPAAMIFNRKIGRMNDLLLTIITSPSTAFSGLNFLLLYGAFRSLPWDYAEAVFIDGGGHHSVFYKMYLPMAIPTMAVIFVLTFLGAWNDYATFYIYLPATPNLSYGLYLISGVAGAFHAADPQIMAGFVIALLPAVVLYLISQKLIVSKFTVGGLKG